MRFKFKFPRFRDLDFEIPDIDVADLHAGGGETVTTTEETTEVRADGTRVTRKLTRTVTTRTTRKP